MNEPSTYITVSELTFAIKNQLESSFASLSVQGEISNAKLHSSGHFYFDLKDAGAKIAVVLFRAQCQQLARTPKEGDQVMIQGALSVYPPHGKYQMIARSLQYRGMGELLLKLETLKKKLHALGWFDKEKKKNLPKFPRTIGVVTSPTGAVIKDIIQVLSRRTSDFHLILNPVRVQGTEASSEIAQAIAEFNKYQLADVLIVGRGGGSLEDLWPFNEEIVAKAIFESAIPIISAVGHETDVTLADFVADVRAPTPSAAAEIVMEEKTHHLELLKKSRKTLEFNISQHLLRTRAQLQNYTRLPIFLHAHPLLAEPTQKLDDLQYRLDTKMRETLLKKKYALLGRQKQAFALKPTTQMSMYRLKLNQVEKRASLVLSNHLQVKKLKLKEIKQRLEAIDPKNVLKRGYCILFSEKENSAIVSSQMLSPGKKIQALLCDGTAKLTVDHE